MNTKQAKYERLYKQLFELLKNDSDLIAQMATINAVLYHKMSHFFWVGFYFVQNKLLVVGPYQGPLACQILPYPDGVCWAAVNRNEAIAVDDVHKFPGHIACDSRSASEIVLPLRNGANKIIAVLDIDSDKINQFDDDDIIGLSSILSLLNPLYFNAIKTV
jgi:GAF domain-containing protein